VSAARDAGVRERYLADCERQGIEPYHPPESALAATAEVLARVERRQQNRAAEDLSQPDTASADGPG
jgi:hypothetical protein